MSLTSGQTDATQRRELYGAVYALSGTLLSRAPGIPDAELRWSNLSFSGGPTGDHYESYFTLPQDMVAELPFRLGDAVPLFPFRLNVRNLPFRHSESIMTSIVDEDYAWEGSEATLWVGYLKPGQGPEDLDSEDWSVIRGRGQLGSPRDITPDGFTIPLLSRDTERTMRVHYPIATSGQWPNIHPEDEGRVYPIVVGHPDAWFRAIRTDTGIWGLTTEAASGATTFRTSSEFSPSQVSGLIGEQVYIRRLGIVRTVTGIAETGLGSSSGGGVWDISVNAAVPFEVPRGALIHQKKDYYDFVPCLNDLGSEANLDVGLELTDGRIIEIGGNIEARSRVASQETPFGKFRPFGLRETGDSPVYPFLVQAQDLPNPTLIVEAPGDPSIIDQPDFATDEQVEATKVNIPTGPAGASAAFDGNEQTGASIPSGGGNSITFTFPSITGGNFSNSDTTRSIIRFRVQGNVQVIVPPSTNIATVTGATGGSDFQFILSTAQEFDASVRFIEQGSGAVVYSVEWQHDLSRGIDLSRIQDVTLDPGEDGSTQLIEAETVSNIYPIRAIVVRASASSFNLHSSFNRSPWDDSSGGVLYTRPTSVFSNLQFLLMERHEEDSQWGDPDVAGSFGAVSGFSQERSHYERFIDMAAYDAAQAKYAEHNINLDFVLLEHVPWHDLERELAVQCRSYAFYGPNGHELHFIEDPEDVQNVSPEATFRLAGVPNANVVAGSTFYERTSPADIINSVEVHYWRRWLQRSGSSEAVYRRAVDVTNSESAAVFGTRRAGEPLELWAVSPHKGFSGSGATATPDAQAQLIGDFIVKRHGFARTRFQFETGWIAHGLRRGALVRVIFAAAPGVYRNILCEVESLSTSPINTERRTLTCRSVAAPFKGLEPSLIWTDLFTDEDDGWADRFTGVFDRWEQYFAVEAGE